MKQTKRILSAALALVLAFALLVPAGAAIDPNAPVITALPNSPISVKIGKSFTLTAQARLPAGAEGTLSYAWYEFLGNRLVATGPSATITAEASINGMKVEKYYYVVVTNTYEDENGVQQTASVESGTTAVLIINSIIGAGLSPILTDNPLRTILFFPANLLTYMMFLFSSIAYTFVDFR